MTAAKSLDNACLMAQSTRWKKCISMSYGAVALACADQRIGMRTELNPASFIKRNVARPRRYRD